MTTQQSAIVVMTAACVFGALAAVGFYVRRDYWSIGVLVVLPLVIMASFVLSR